jgi:signal transduction histidine kinase
VAVGARRYVAQVATSASNVTARARAVDPEWVDWAVAACLLIASEVAIWTPTLMFARVGTAIWAAVVCCGVALRRRWLLQCLGVALVVRAVQLVGYGSGAPDLTGTVTGVVGSLSALLLFYGGGAFLEGWRSRLALALGVALLSLSAATAGSQFVANLIWDVAIIGLLPWFVGRMVRERTARGLAARQRAELLDAQREYHARAAALGERARLAREIHDVIAHSVSVMVIQTAGARTVMDREPERADEALLSVERAGREALAELRRLLGVLGDGQHMRQLAPQPGIEDLDELVSRTREAGLPASISVVGEPIAVAPGLSLCAYRVVQEALTNAIKHAGAARAEVAVRWGPDALELEVVDDGSTARDGDPAPGGHGLVGMRERTALHGGSVEAGPGPAGGFVVRARIPLADRSVLV